MLDAAGASTTSEVVMRHDATFADQLKSWRARRGLSQLALAGRAEISQRHLSFLELGRAAPSREMVDRLAGALDLPLRQHNALLLAAGFAPEWRQRDLAAPDLAQVTRALDYILAQQEPYPVVVVDRHWNLLQSNAGAARLVEFLAGPIAPGAAVNLADALVGPDVLKPHLVNWAEVVRHFIRSVEADAQADGLVETQALLDRLMRYPGVRTALQAGSTGADGGPVLAMHFRKQDISLRLFTTIATLGTPQDVTLQELRIESFFPMDEATATILRGWAKQRATSVTRRPAAARAPAGPPSTH
jgi:transcriptional regulator with XRE-family HTH domain